MISGGHGLSDKVDYGLNMERFALDLKELIEYLELKGYSISWLVYGCICYI